MDLIGKPLELDTDGIWTLLPELFPENFKLKLNNSKEILFSYPCSLMNYLIYDKFKNP
jgi:DNA polymerase epsilon subunit 1